MSSTNISTLWNGSWYIDRFGTGVALEDAIGSHACSLEASLRVTNVILLGCSIFLQQLGTVIFRPEGTHHPPPTLFDILL
jgi:hypothetical protein